MVDEYKRGYLVADQEFVLGGRQAFSQMVCQQQPIDGCARSHFAIAPGSRAIRKYPNYFLFADHSPRIAGSAPHGCELPIGNRHNKMRRGQRIRSQTRDTE
jgi:hypothetical protein